MKAAAMDRVHAVSTESRLHIKYSIYDNIWNLKYVVYKTTETLKPKV